MLSKQQKALELKRKAVNYHADSLGTQKNYKVLGEAVLQMRAGQELKGNWKQEIEEDYKTESRIKEIICKILR